MINLLRAQRGRFALLLSGLVVGYAAAAWKRIDPIDFDPWAID